jgi:hypothetical protein
MAALPILDGLPAMNVTKMDPAGAARAYFEDRLPIRPRDDAVLLLGVDELLSPGVATRERARLDLNLKVRGVHVVCRST